MMIGLFTAPITDCSELHDMVIWHNKLFGVVCDAQPACEISPLSSARDVVINPLQVSREVFRCGLVTAAGHKNSQTELDAFRNAQPVQVAQERRDPMVFTTVVHQSRCRIEYGLQTTHQTPCDAVECDAVVVESRQNQRGDEGQQNRLADGATDAAYVTQSCKTTGRANFGTCYAVARAYSPEQQNAGRACAGLCHASGCIAL